MRPTDTYRDQLGFSSGDYWAGSTRLQSGIWAYLSTADSVQEAAAEDDK